VVDDPVVGEVDELHAGELLDILNLADAIVREVELANAGQRLRLLHPVDHRDRLPEEV
jgi:hypothetical protein